MYTGDYVYSIVNVKINFSLLFQNNIQVSTKLIYVIILKA